MGMQSSSLKKTFIIKNSNKIDNGQTEQLDSTF